MNSHIYDTDDKKIVFILSFPTDGAAQTWKESFLTKKAKKDGGYNLGTAAAFTTALKDAFSPSDVTGNAWAGLWNLKQTRSADEYISQFQILARQSGIISSIALIKYFMEDWNLASWTRFTPWKKYPPTSLDGTPKPPRLITSGTKSKKSKLETKG